MTIETVMSACLKDDVTDVSCMLCLMKHIQPLTLTFRGTNVKSELHHYLQEREQCGSYDDNNNNNSN